MRMLFALVAWLASLAAAAEGEGSHMAAEDDVIHLATMAAPPWTATANERATSDHTGFEPCEQVVNAFATALRGAGAVATTEAYTTSRRWGKILRAKVTPDSAGVPATLVTCWIGDHGRASVVVKVDDGEP